METDVSSFLRIQLKDCSLVDLAIIRLELKKIGLKTSDVKILKKEGKYNVSTKRSCNI